MFDAITWIAPFLVHINGCSTGVERMLNEPRGEGRFASLRRRAGSGKEQALAAIFPSLRQECHKLGSFGATDLAGFATKTLPSVDARVFFSATARRTHRLPTPAPQLMERIPQPGKGRARTHRLGAWPRFRGSGTFALPIL